tara:strand:- start:2494 stop:2832 length:339 start_codon:yes stop_codon:yes gene_type:complete
MQNIKWNDFKKIEIRIGTIIDVNDFPEAIKPAYKLKIDLGNKIGIKTSSAQITELYTKNKLIGKQVIVVTNLEPKKIGPFISECLVMGFYISKKSVILATSDRKVENGLLLV